MGFTVTPARRRMAMAAAIALAIAGGIIRALAPDPSTARDVGTLLLVLWLPAVGNFVGYLRGKLPKAAPPPTSFPADEPFTPHLRVQLERIPLAGDFAPSIKPEQLATVLVGRRGFTARFAGPLAAWVAGDGESTVSLQLLRPAAAREFLKAGTEIHLLVGQQPVARGRVLDAHAD